MASNWISVSCVNMVVCCFGRSIQLRDVRSYLFLYFVCNGSHMMMMVDDARSVCQHIIVHKHRNHMSYILIYLYICYATTRILPNRKISYITAILYDRVVKSAPLRLAAETITCYMNFRNYFRTFGAGRC